MAPALPGLLVRLERGVALDGVAFRAVSSSPSDPLTCILTGNPWRACQNVVPTLMTSSRVQLIHAMAKLYLLAWQWPG